MKKIIVGFLALFLVGSTVYAAGSSNIVSVLVNGKPVQSGQIIDGSTMLPLKAIAQALGAQVAWDNTKKQASITTAQTPTTSVQDGLSLEQLNKIGESVGLVTAFDAAGNSMRSGSGFILNGMFITNHHVVEGSSSLKIIFGMEETTVPSSYIFDDSGKDLAAVKYIEGVSLKLNTNAAQKGEKVYALGYPLKKFQVSDGEVLFFTVTGEITHSAHITNGSSGGILINSSGEVIGVTNAALDDTQYNNAIPAQVLQDELNNL